jgi:hypothetical protein
VETGFSSHFAATWPAPATARTKRSEPPWSMTHYGSGRLVVTDAHGKRGPRRTVQPRG